MKNSFGRHNTHNGNGSSGSGGGKAIVTVLAIIIGLAAIIYLFSFITSAGDAPAPPALPAAPLLLGWLDNPFKTTRKMNVPFHARKGHSQRATERFFTFIVCLALFILVVTSFYIQVNP